VTTINPPGEQVAAMLVKHRANAMSVPMQPDATWADVAMKAREIAFNPITSHRTLVSATALRLAAEAAQ
jgi:hypothetical protein